jgi:tripartite-type tricarboxylate transporter receptor subunit TctC
MHRLIMGAVAIVFSAVGVSAASSQDYPTRPVQILVGTSAGGAVDVMARALAEDIRSQLDGTFVVINKPGRNGTIAATQVLRASPDGYTLGFQAVGAFVSDPFTPEGVPYTLDDADFLCQLFEPAVALAAPPDSKFKSVSDVVAAAKRDPGKITVGTVGPGSVPGITVRLFEKAAGIELNEIPYKGDAENVSALLGHDTDLAVPGLSTVANKGVAILASFSQSRSPAYPDIPTIKELGYPVVKFGMVGLFSPAGMPAATRRLLVDACAVAARDGQRVRDASKSLGQEISYVGPTEWRGRIKADGAENKPILEQFFKK